MRNALVLLACTSFLCSVAQAQQNSAVNLLDSPIKSEPVYAAGETIMCSIALPATAALFGTDTCTGTTPAAPRFVTDELFGPGFRVWMTDDACNLLSSWSTAFAGSTMTGIAVPNGNAPGHLITHYWTIDPFGFSATRYVKGTGAVVPASTIPIPAGSLWGAAVIDDNQGGEVLCIDDIATDTYTCINAAAGGAFLCSYANVDNAGGGAFGNGMGDAVTPAACSGATLVQATGTINEGQVTRVGQYDCVTTDPACSDRWSVGQFSTFVNGIEEFLSTALGGRALVVVDNVTSTFLVVTQPVGIGDCQDIDANMDVVWVNGSQGGGDFNVDVATAGTLAVADQKVPGSNGKFVHHMNAGTPNAGTVSKLFDLGNDCFDFLGGTAVVVENNVGKTNLVGASNYFGNPIADPAKSPTFLASLTQASIDTGNLPAGSSFTHQAIHLNPAASSKKGGSLSNAVIMTMQ
jgi:hypothetical protein